jgi:putative oxidoreductase
MFKPALLSPYALAALRIVATLLFVEHATQKFFHFPVAIPGVPDPLPTMLVIAGALELITAAFLVLGLWTRVAAFVASGLMAFAYFLGHFPFSFWPAVNGGEAAILYCFIFLYIAFQGAGAFALDNVRANSLHASAAKT